MDNQTPWLIAGLGNPGAKYEKNWHNAGFLALEVISQKNGIKMSKIKFKGIYGQGTIMGEKAILLKPTTFMNLSGESLLEAKTFFKIPDDRIIVIYDDIDVQRGSLRIRQTGSAGSHNGMKSVITHLNTKEFARIRIGIGPLPPESDLIDYVLTDIDAGNRQVLFDSFQNVNRAIEIIVSKGISYAMNEFNRKDKVSE